MKQKKDETIPVGLLVGLLFLCTAAAGGIALLVPIAMVALAAGIIKACV